jgi:hypothetical protein
MKKTLGLTFLTLFLVCCEVGPRQVKAESPVQKVSSPSGFGGVYCTTYTVNSMEYKIFSMYDGGMCMVNHTKEQLEVELLRKQLAE